MNASSAEEFAQCLSTFEGVKNCLVFCGGISGKLAEPPSKIQDISLCHSFDFLNDGILVKKMAGIGLGRKETDLKPYDAKPTYNCTLYNADKESIHFKVRKGGS